MLVDAARRARDEGDDRALVRASMSMSHLGATSAFGRPDPEQLTVVEDALAVLGTEPTATRARLLIELAVQVGDTRVERGIAMATEAEAIARALGILRCSKPCCWECDTSGAIHVGSMSTCKEQSSSNGSARARGRWCRCSPG